MPTKDPPRRALAAIIATLSLCTVFTALSTAAHAALATAFSGMIAVTLVLPPLVLACSTWLSRALVIAVGVASVIFVWLTLEISWPQWVECSAVAAAYGVAIAGVSTLFCSRGLSTVVSAAMTVIIALAWLAWPIWLSPYLPGHQSLVNALVIAHPLLTLNGVLIDKAIWTERPLMYSWTALNQDVAYSMPPNIFGCVVLQAAIGCIAIVVASRLSSRSRQIAAEDRVF